MQATRSFQNSGFSKRSLVAIFAASFVALMLGGIGGYVAKTLSLPATIAAIHIVAGQPGASGYGSSWNYSSLRSGTQSVEGPESFDDPLSVHHGGTQIVP